MAYVGQSAPIPLGQLGLRTDDPMTNLPPNAAIKANNITFTAARVEKSKGSSKYNSTSLGSPVVHVVDYFPTPTTQRLIAATEDGKLWRDTGDGTFSTNTPVKTGLGTLTNSAWTCTGGAEQQGQNKKLFFFSGSSQIQVFNGDTATPSNIANPASDWASGNYPTWGVIFQGKLVVGGSPADRHRIYINGTHSGGPISNDHEFFNGTLSEAPTTISVFPGEGDGIVSAQVYKGRLFLFKQPYGVYYIETNGSFDPLDWGPQKLSDAFGIASPHSVVQVLDDLIVANSHGGVNSLQATQAFGDLKAGDVLTNNQIEEYLRTQLDSTGIPEIQMIYYAEKKKAYMTGTSAVAAQMDRMLVMDVAKQNARFSIETKDQPTCLTLRKDPSGIERPIYGADDGFVYLMERNVYSVDGDPYNGEFQTPYIDFSYLDPVLASKNKLFDFLELQYSVVGNWPVYVDIFIDNKFSETLTVNTQSIGVLDDFTLDTDVLSEETTVSRRLQIHGSGKRISFKIYNNLVGQYFKVEKLICNFRLSAEQENK